MTTLLVGFDSAWTATKCGAIVGVLLRDDGSLEELGPPLVANYSEAERIVVKWQAEQEPASTILLLDQPTIVLNPSGQRPVENIVASAVSRRHGGMQPANIGRREMFGSGAPIWSFLARFGGAADPLRAEAPARVIETYPVLTMIALGWMLQDSRAAGRLPKYNPQRKKTFSLADWEHVCRLAQLAFSGRGLPVISQWIDGAARNKAPRKSDQDLLDACMCLLVALYLADGRPCLMVGDQRTGYIVVPDAVALRSELEARCDETGRIPGEWVRVFRLA
jgi:predicted RNase H-like nuclease